MQRRARPGYSAFFKQPAGSVPCFVPTEPRLPSLRERSCYDEGKRVSETLTMDYHREHGLAVRIVRIFNTYGPHMSLDDGRVVSNFVAQALRGEPLTVYGDGQQTRSFQFVSDLVRGLMAVMDNEQGLIGPFNLGNPTEFTILELAQLVKEVVYPAVDIVFRENTADDPKASGWLGRGLGGRGWVRRQT